MQPCRKVLQWLPGRVDEGVEIQNLQIQIVRLGALSTLDKSQQVNPACVDASQADLAGV